MVVIGPEVTVTAGGFFTLVDATVIVEDVTIVANFVSANAILVDETIVAFVGQAVVEAVVVVEVVCVVAFFIAFNDAVTAGAGAALIGALVAWVGVAIIARFELANGVTFVLVKMRPRSRVGCSGVLVAVTTRCPYADPVVAGISAAFVVVTNLDAVVAIVCVAVVALVVAIDDAVTASSGRAVVHAIVCFNRVAIVTSFTDVQLAIATSVGFAVVVASVIVDEVGIIAFFEHATIFTVLGVAYETVATEGFLANGQAIVGGNAVAIVTSHVCREEVGR